MGYYRITYDGYVEGEYESADEAKAEFIKSLEENDPDQYICVEKFDEATKEWI